MSPSQLSMERERRIIFAGRGTLEGRGARRSPIYITARRFWGLRNAPAGAIACIGGTLTIRSRSSGQSAMGSSMGMPTTGATISARSPIGIRASLTPSFRHYRPPGKEFRSRNSNQANTLHFLSGLFRGGDVFCTVEMLLQGRQRCTGVSFQVRILGIVRFFRVHGDGFGMSRDHLLNVAVVESRALQLFKGRNHLLMRGIEAFRHSEGGFPRNSTELIVVAGMICDQHLSVVFDGLRRGIGGGQLTQIGFGHVSLRGKIDKLLVCHRRSSRFGPFLLSQRGQATESKAANG